jgi:protein tyrosine/serine phosphatase
MSHHPGTYVSDEAAAEYIREAEKHEALAAQARGLAARNEDYENEDGESRGKSYWRAEAFREKKRADYLQARRVEIDAQVGALVRRIEEDDRAPLRFGGSAEALELAREVK